jgi:hypothetical protein
VRLKAAAFSLGFAVFFAALGHAQSPSGAQPPLPGFVPPYEINKIVRSAGFSPLAPPLREGTTYVLRATDYHGILMRVVVDARSGAIRAVNRIVPAYEVGLMGPPYGEPPPYGTPPGYGPPGYRPPGYGPQAYAPPGYGPHAMAAPEMGPEEADLDPALGPPPGYGLPPPPPSVHPASLQFAPPLPRPRPPELATRDFRSAPQPADTKPAEQPAAKVDAKPETKPDAPSASPPVATAAPPAKKPSPPTPAIQD